MRSARGQNCLRLSQMSHWAPPAGNPGFFPLLVGSFGNSPPSLQLGRTAPASPRPSRDIKCVQKALSPPPTDARPGAEQGAARVHPPNQPRRPEIDTSLFRAFIARRFRKALGAFRGKGRALAAGGPANSGNNPPAPSALESERGRPATLRVVPPSHGLRQQTTRRAINHTRGNKPHAGQ